MGRRKKLGGTRKRSTTIEGVEKLFRKRRGEINAEICRNCIQHVCRGHDKYWETDRIMDQKMDRLMFSVGDGDDESDTEELNSDDHEDNY